MWFNSIDYFFFFLVVYISYWATPPKFQKYILLFSSFFFYAYWSLSFFIHFFAITSISYLFVVKLRQNKSKAFLFFGVGINLANLLFFKYSQAIINGILKDNPSPPPYFASLPEIILPLAISFYTFQILAFIVDTYRGQTDGIGFWDYVLFIFFFPQLIAGPIMRHTDFFFQLGKVQLTKEKIQEGCLRILSGAFKKILIADQMAAMVNPIWNDPYNQTSITVVLAVIGFSIQVYCDFSGYTDIARGSALLLGYRIPENFRAPYFSISFAELWTRWHITLSTWLRDYLYIPLGGSKVAAWRHQMNTIIVMSLGGLWHGSTYTFFLWGLIHGTFLIIERRLGKATKDSKWQFQVLGFTLVTLGWLIGAAFFRAGSWDTIVGMTVSLMKPGGTNIFLEKFFTLVILCYGIQFLEFKNFFKERITWKLEWMIPILSLMLYFSITRIRIIPDQFIYFQF
jgi:D-alanyl-lipoteichoic acid acyltransferase DltB (MBOAT superfamily)